MTIPFQVEVDWIKSIRPEMDEHTLFGSRSRRRSTNERVCSAECRSVVRNSVQGRARNHGVVDPTRAPIQEMQRHWQVSVHRGDKTHHVKFLRANFPR